MIFVVRDIVCMVDVFDEDGFICYWGFFYGSVLGEIIVVMFFDCIDRMIIDGVVNFYEWYNDVVQVFFLYIDFQFFVKC